MSSCLLGDVMAHKKGMVFKIDQMHSRIDSLLQVQLKFDWNVQAISDESMEEAGLYSVIDTYNCTKLWIHCNALHQQLQAINAFGLVR